MIYGEPIIIDFNDKLDHVLAQSFILITCNRKKIEGEIVLENNEEQWVFKPKKEWKTGNYEIFVNKSLEDIATNSMNQLFDHKPENFENITSENLIIDFTIR